MATQILRRSSKASQSANAAPQRPFRARRAKRTAHRQRREQSSSKSNDGSKARTAAFKGQPAITKALSNKSWFESHYRLGRYLERNRGRSRYSANTTATPTALHQTRDSNFESLSADWLIRDPVGADEWLRQYRANHHKPLQSWKSQGCKSCMSSCLENIVPKWPWSLHRRKNRTSCSRRDLPSVV